MKSDYGDKYNFLESDAINLICLWCRTPQQVHRFIQIIVSAKSRLEEQDVQQIYIHLGDEKLKPIITQKLRRFFFSLRTRNGKNRIKDIESYLYAIIRQNLVKFINDNYSGTSDGRTDKTKKDKENFVESGLKEYLL